MAYKFLDAYSNVDGFMPLLYAIRDSVPFAYQATLLVLILIFGIGSFFATTQISTRGRIVVSLAGSTFIVAVLSVFFAMARLIDVYSMAFFIALSIMSFIVLVFYK